ncbi:carboxypeptidase regulatory-like domain-containing protein [Aquisphaera insulae]|uniref:carboxypeptidase regulatory-like domain-containing protein n=1 Tax=Aquisphaera insulae TaxID=2712864 RepID=UPI0013EBE227|nr:carboxypeptidase regulatory-like domain-containing protein [Aquisphaera insulae]
MEPNQAGPASITNEQGQFEVPPSSAFVVAPGDGQLGPMFRLRAEDARAWRLELDDDREPGNSQNRTALDQVTPQIQARWKGEGPEAVLVVESPPVGEVETTVRGPDGALLEDRAVQLVMGDEGGNLVRAALVYAGKTDRNGGIRFRAFEGTRPFAIRVPGVGYGATGRVEIVAGQVTRTTLPPLARFARIEGRLAQGLLVVGTTIALHRGPFGYEVGPRTPCDDQGRFTVVDVPAGECRLSIWSDSKEGTASSATLNPEPGQVLRDVVINDRKPASPEVIRESQRVNRGMNGDPKAILTWVEGTVRDEKGRPLPAATLYLRTQHHGGRRLNEEVHRATSGGDGRYRFEGPLLASMGTMTIVATASGRPPVVAYAPGPNSYQDESQRKPARLDVTLAPASAAASVRVQVEEDGKGLEAVPIWLSPVDGVLLDQPGYAGAVRVTERDALTDLVSPLRRSDQEALARFENLMPGTFQLTAGVAPEMMAFPQLFGGGQSAPPSGIVRGLAVPPGGRLEARMGVYPHRDSARIRLLAPDGSPVAGRPITLRFGRGSETTTTFVNTDAEGVIQFQFGSPGLWTVELLYQNATSSRYSVQGEPCYRAESTIAVSPAAPREDPVTVRAVRREPGSIRARLLDTAGKPASGSITIVGPFADPTDPIGTTDAAGIVTFADLPSGRYRLLGFLRDRLQAPLPQTGRNHLEDEALRDHIIVFEREVDVTSGAEVSIDLKAEPVGYVRAVLRMPRDQEASDPFVSLRDDGPYQSYRGFELDRPTRTYLIGPLRPGRWPLEIQEDPRDAGTPTARRWSFPIDVQAGRVIHTEVDAGPANAETIQTTSNRPVGLDLGGIRLFDSGPEGFSATVVQADGESPAYAARALFWPAGGREPVARGIADGAGGLTWAGLWMSTGRSHAKGLEPVKQPTIAAWLPGRSGPVVAVVDPSKPARLVLPPTASAAGRVTLGGRPATARDQAQIRVVIAADGRGVLGPAFDREVTSDPEGRFEFPDLAPGRYQVQAVRDDIWLSEAVPIEVVAGQRPVPVDLDVPAPGASVELTLVGSGNRPVAGRSFTIRRRAGPITTVPLSYRTDDQGAALVRGLEPGLHSLLVEGDSGAHGFQVPRAQSEGTIPKIRVQISGREP